MDGRARALCQARTLSGVHAARVAAVQLARCCDVMGEWRRDSPLKRNRRRISAEETTAATTTTQERHEKMTSRKKGHHDIDAIRALLAF